MDTTRKPIDLEAVEERYRAAINPDGTDDQEVIDCVEDVPLLVAELRRLQAAS